MESAENRNQYTVINPISLFKKMMSYKALIIASLLIGITLSLIWGMLLYKPSFNLSAIYSYNISTDSTLTNMYGVQYLAPDYFVEMMQHPNTISAFLEENGISTSEISVVTFQKHFNVEYERGQIKVYINNIKKDYFTIYKEYVSYCLILFNEQNILNVRPLLEVARSNINEELTVVKNKEYETEMLNSANFSYSITLNDRIKYVDTQINEINKGTVRKVSDFAEIKVSSRAKTMILIVIFTLFVGVIADFFICLVDTHIYFSDEITDIPSLRKRLLSCIPLYRSEGISNKEFINISSKLPDDISSISVSEISEHSGAQHIAEGLSSVSPSISISYIGSLLRDADILSGFGHYSVNLIVVRAGIDTINQVRNIVRDCKIKGVDNYYFVLYGLEPTDKSVILFEDNSHYIRNSLYSLSTLRQHYTSNYYKEGANVGN